VLGVVVQNESPGGWAISAGGDPWLCVPASRRVCPEQSFEATIGFGVGLRYPFRLIHGRLAECAAGQRDRPLKPRYDGPDDEYQRMSAISSESLEEAERVRVAHARATRRLAASERQAEAVLGGAFALAAVALALSGAGGPASLVVGASCVAALAIASRVSFDVGAGFTVPTQIAFVPMLLSLPPFLVPPLTVLALGLGMAPDVLAGRVPASRLFVVPGNSWFAIGPAGVLAINSHDGALPPVWALGMLLAAQFICDLGANAVRERLQHRAELIELLREVRWVFVVDLALFPLGLALTLATQMRPWAVLLAAPLFGLLSVFSRERRARLDQLVELNNAYRGTALVLGDVVEADDRYTGAHSRGVVALAIAVGDALGLNRAQRRNLEFGALLHDVGKVAIPKDIINKPGKLDPAEWTIVKTHTVEGQRMLDRVGGFMREVGVIVRSHHERWDGSGYPDGLAGDGIPLEARIVACCDAWNAMTTTRSYRDAMPISDAVAEMRRSAGTQFDPRVVDALLERVLDHTSSSIGAEPPGAQAA
jgi:putative nucleotidyltransferase with HDIG domain